MKGNEVDCMLLRFSQTGGDELSADLAAGLVAAGARTVHEVRSAYPADAAYPADLFDSANSADLADFVDAALDELGERRLVVAATTAELQLVLRRLLRAGRLDAVSTAVVTVAPPAYLRTLGLPSDVAGQLRRAAAGSPRLVGVVKDDSGGLCLDSAAVTPWAGTGDSTDSPASKWWVRAVVDDEPLCDGPVRAVTLRRLGPAQLEATVRLGRWRTRTVRGRSLQLACDPALITQDGVERARARTKRTFWSEPALWKLCL